MMPPLSPTTMDMDDSSDSDLSVFSTSPVCDTLEDIRLPPTPTPRKRYADSDSASDSDLSSFKSISPPPTFSLQRPLSPPTSHDADEDMLSAPPRKRRKVEPRARTTQHLDLTSDDAQSEYDRQRSLELLLKAIHKRRKIVVIAGAGISVSAGIPDFRSSHGLFRSLRAEHKLKSSGKELFDASVYKDDSSTSSFHDMVRQLSQLSKDAQPSLFHRLLARLATEGRLLRLYTQNVDGLENRLPPLATTTPLPHKAPWPKTIQVHGGLEKMVCQKCRKISDFDEELFRRSTPPPCPECQLQDNLRTEHAGKRSHGIGRLRPRIVLYNEHNPDDEAIGAVTAADFRTRPDCVIVVGTSMKIPAIKRITDEMCKIVRDRKEGTTIWINRDPEPPSMDYWDLTVKGDADDVAQRAQLKDWNDTSSTITEPYTDSDVEKSKVKGIPVIEIQSPKRIKTEAVQVGGPATPPTSPMPAKASKAPPKFILEIPRATATTISKASLANPASKYKPLKATTQFGSQSKKAPRPQQKRPYIRDKKQQLGQLAKFGKVTKSAAGVTPVNAEKKASHPLSPNQNVPAPAKSPVMIRFPKLGFSSNESSPYPETPPDMLISTPPALFEGTYQQSTTQPRPSSSNDNRDTISPSSVPKGMRDLLSYAE